jgi:hypothetical protein
MISDDERGEKKDDMEETDGFMSRRRFLETSSAVLVGALAPDLGAAESTSSAASHGANGAASGEAPPESVLNGLKVDVCERTGGLTNLSYGGLGSLLRQEEDLAELLTLRYPAKDFVPLMLESRVSQAQIARAADGLSISWDRLTGNRAVELPAGRVSASVDIRSAPDGRSVVLRARIENHSEGEIVEVLFPDLSGLRPTDEPEQMELRMALGTINPLAGPAVAAGRAPFYAQALWKEYEHGGGYNRNALRWMDYGSLKGGFSLFERSWLIEPRANIMIHRNEADPQELRVVWQHDVRLRPGEVWESPEFWLTPHAGGWAGGIDSFRDYVRAVNPPRAVPVPERVRRGLGFQTIWMMQASECDPKYAAFRFSDFGRIARDAKSHGIDEIVVWGWCHYGTFPITVRKGLGSVEEMLAGIREAREMGVSISLFVSLKEIEDRFAASYGLKPGSAGAWIYHPEMIPAMLPLNSPSKHVEVPSDNVVWQRDVYAGLTEWVSRGVTSFSWDVFDDQGGMGLIELIRRVRENVTPGAAGSFSGEVLDSFERAAQVLDYTWCWNDYLEAGPYTAALGYPRINTNVQNSARVTKMAFADNLYINAMPKWPNQPNGTKLIGEEAELSTALKQVAPLRSRFVEYFTDGDYLGDSFLLRPVAPFVRKYFGHIQMTPQDTSEFEYPPVMVRGYRLNGRLLVIVLNNEERSRHITIESNLSMWLPGVRSCRVKGYDERGQQDQTGLWHAGEKWIGTIGTLRPLELAFFEVSAA